jgi:hypothetical protein
MKFMPADIKHTTLRTMAKDIRLLMMLECKIYQKELVEGNLLFYLLFFGTKSVWAAEIELMLHFSFFETQNRTLGPAAGLPSQTYSIAENSPKNLLGKNSYNWKRLLALLPFDRREKNLGIDPCKHAKKVLANVAIPLLPLCLFQISEWY